MQFVRELVKFSGLKRTVVYPEPERHQLHLIDVVVRCCHVYQTWLQVLLLLVLLPLNVVVSMHAVFVVVAAAVAVVVVGIVSVSVAVLCLRYLSFFCYSPFVYCTLLLQLLASALLLARLLLLLLSLLLYLLLRWLSLLLAEVFLQKPGHESDDSCQYHGHVHWQLSSSFTIFSASLGAATRITFLSQHHASS